MSVAGTDLLGRWRACCRLPFGSWLFSRAMGWLVPYTGTIGGKVVSLEPGRAVVILHDRRRVRNHLDSIHAIALANLGEFASGLAMLTAVGKDTRGIVSDISVSYHKKARGTLTATGTASPPDPQESVESEAIAQIVDTEGDLVAMMTATWLLSPKPSA